MIPKIHHSSQTSLSCFNAVHTDYEYMKSHGYLHYYDNANIISLKFVFSFSS